MNASSAPPSDHSDHRVAAPSGSNVEFQQFHDERVRHWDQVAIRSDTWDGLGGYYHRRLAEIYGHLIAPGQRILELGCGCGDLLAAVQPAEGVGIDLSPQMIQRARRRHPQLRFEVADAAEVDLDRTFDVVILSDLVNELWDVHAVFDRIRRLTHPRGRIVLNFFSRMWQLPLDAARTMGLADPLLEQNWLTVSDIKSLLSLADLELVRHWPEVLWPLRTPLVDVICNRWLVRFWPFTWFALTNMVVARPRPMAPVHDGSAAPRVSVVVPARNEAGNIESIVRRTPDLAGGTELIFVEGNSTDDTYATIERVIADHPDRSCRLLKQAGKGKGDAVRAGFNAATGDVLVILDADLTVPPEDLPRFVDALVSGKGDFINGVRLVYPMQGQAMRFANLVGNKVFSLTLSWLLGQSVKDTLCGTKVLWREDYNRIAANRSYFGDFDPFGDFDLLFGAAKLNLRILDLPIRYRQRTYGTTNIQRWRHGVLLLRMTAFAATKLKFV